MNKEKIYKANNDLSLPVDFHTSFIYAGFPSPADDHMDISLDLNEYLIKHGPEKLKNVINKATQVPLEGVSTLKDVEDDLKDFVKNGFKPGYQVGLSNFDNIFSTYTGQFITVTGIPSGGKSDFVDQMSIG